jgi:hypothetical protein
LNAVPEISDIPEQLTDGIGGNGQFAIAKDEQTSVEESDAILATLDVLAYYTADRVASIAVAHCSSAFGTTRTHNQHPHGRPFRRVAELDVGAEEGQKDTIEEACHYQTIISSVGGKTYPAKT